MAYTKWQIEHVSSAGTTTTLSQYHDPILEVNLGDGKDSFSFKVQNGNGDFDSFFEARDQITIYRVTNTDTVTSSDIIMVGSISDNPFEVSGRKEMLNIKGYNYSEALMGSIVFIDATAKTVAQTIEEALNNAGNFHPTFKVTWNANNPSLKRDGSTAFPTVGKRYFYKTLKQILEELSSNKFTEDGRYYWYVNKDNELIWRPDTSYAGGTFIDTTDRYKRLKVGRDTSKVINYIVAKGGITPSGQPVTIYRPNYPSIAKHGMKFHYLVDETITVNTLVKADLDADGADNAARYPDMSSSFTTSWTYLGDTATLDNGTTATNGSTITFAVATTGSEANSQADYNQALKLHIQAELKRFCDELLNIRSLGQQQVDLELQPGQVSWGLGDQIDLTLDQLGGTPKTLRVQEIQYTTDVDTYSLVEDVGSI